MIFVVVVSNLLEVQVCFQEELILVFLFFIHLFLFVFSDLHFFLSFQTFFGLFESFFQFYKNLNPMILILKYIMINLSKLLIFFGTKQDFFYLIYLFPNCFILFSFSYLSSFLFPVILCLKRLVVYFSLFLFLIFFFYYIR